MVEGTKNITSDVVDGTKKVTSGIVDITKSASTGLVDVTKMAASGVVEGAKSITRLDEVLFRKSIISIGDVDDEEQNGKKEVLINKNDRKRPFSNILPKAQEPTIQETNT
jgi:hypothetical protein